MKTPLLYILYLSLILFFSGCTPANMATPEYLIQLNTCSGFAISAELVVTAAHCDYVKYGTTIHNQILYLERVYVNYDTDVSIYKADRTILLETYATFYQGEKMLGLYYGMCPLYFFTTGRPSLIGSETFYVFTQPRKIIIPVKRIYGLYNVYDDYTLYCSGDSGGIMIVEGQVAGMGSSIPIPDEHATYAEFVYMSVVSSQTLESEVQKYITGDDNTWKF